MSKDLVHAGEESKETFIWKVDVNRVVNYSLDSTWYE